MSTTPRRSIARRLVALAAAPTLAFGLVACGDDGGTDTVAQDEFQERAGEACGEFFGSMLASVLEVMDPVTGEPDPAEEDALGEELTSHADRMLSELRSIGAPEGQVDEWEEWVGLLEESIDEIRDDPMAGFDEEPRNPERADRIDELSDELGVPACTGDELPADDRTAGLMADAIATGIQSESDGAISDDEADCIAQGFVDAFTPTEIVDGAFTEPEVQAILEDCLPQETIEQLGG